MNGFKFDFSKIFWGGAHRAPSPDPSPVFFSGFALGLDFALNSRALRPRLGLRPRFSGASRPRFSFGLRPQLSIWNLGLAPKVNSWIRQCLYYSLYAVTVVYFRGITVVYFRGITVVYFRGITVVYFEKLAKILLFVAFNNIV